jgi:hypothetical protein
MTTPTVTGWYWISDDEHDDPELVAETGESQWRMAYLVIGYNGSPKLYTLCEELLGDGRFRGIAAWEPIAGRSYHLWKDTECDGTWVGPKRWRGPLEVPSATP